MQVIVFSKSNAALINARAKSGKDTFHLRDSSRWRGEVDPCDAVLFLEPNRAIEAAYQGVPRYELPSEKVANDLPVVDKKQKPTDKKLDSKVE